VSLAATAALAAAMTVVVQMRSAAAAADVPIQDAKIATVLEVNGAIGPATSRYVTKGLETARLNGSRVVVLEIDTPGGLDTSMRDIIRAILASPIPVISYVSPSGARAASAGTYILYASHIAAMAPATNLGAATPVSIGGGNERGSGHADDGAGEKPQEKFPEPFGQQQPGAAGSAERQHAGESQPSAERQPAAGRQLSGERQPSAERRPSEESQRSEGRQPSVERQPPAERQPKAERQPAEESQRSEGRRPSAGRQPEVASSESPMERKILNDAVAYIRGLAELRGRNADWAEQAVRGAASLSANAALKQNVIDVVARDVPDLLSQIDGREIHVGSNVVKLATRDLAIANLKPDWRVELLSVITNPTIAYGLLLIGIYGLLFEGYNPGAVFPGVVGAISLLIALFAFQILSVNYAGLALVAVGVGMIVAEFFFPTFGSLGLGGLIAFIVGSLILFDTDIPGMNIGLPVIAAVATVGGLAIVAMAWLASRSLRRTVVTGVQTMVGKTAEVLEAFNGKGRVRYGGEIWNAVSSSAVQAGQAVRITRVDGLTVWVEEI
jgi:membrane-bound serine protease (ClpP class)